MGDKKLVVYVAKGTSAYIDLTPEEIEQRAVDAQAAAIEKAERDAQEEAKADAKLSAQAKLQALGLTGDEVVALLN
jgi:DNA-binding transcriptional regulator GbsR (MarR family)